jgi:DNA polymerase-3 subunit delta
MFETEVSEVMSILRNGSLFSARRIVIIADAQSITKTVIKVFLEYMRKPSPEAVLIFLADETPGARNYPSEIARALKNSGDCLKIFWEMFENNKKSQVINYFRNKGFTINPEAVDFLVDVTEGTSEALKEACDIIAFTVESRGKEKLISEETIEASLEHTRNETVYSVFARFCRRDLTGVLDAYRKITETDAFLGSRIISLLSMQLSTLRDYKILVSRGYPSDDIFNKLKIRGGKSAKKSYVSGARNFSPEELTNAVISISDLEYRLRTVPGELKVPETEIWFAKVMGKQQPGQV